MEQWQEPMNKTESTHSKVKTYSGDYLETFMESANPRLLTYIHGKKGFLLLLSSIKIDRNKLKIKIMLKEACQNLQCGRWVEAAIDFSDRHLPWLTLQLLTDIDWRV